MQNLRLFAVLAAMLAMIAVVVAAVLWQLDFFRSHQQWTLATGHPSGTYHMLGDELADIATSQLKPYDQFEVEPSAGSAENMARIANGATDFAFVQSDAKPAANARLVATLYDEILHILVRADLDDPTASEMPLESLSKLKHVSLGPAGSGTAQVAEMLLKQFEVELDSSPLHLAPSQLPKKFAEGELDAAFVLAAPGSQLVEQLLDNPNIRLLSLGEGPVGGSPADAFARLHPAFHPQLIPVRLYGKQPTRVVRTIGVGALLVASEAVDSRVVWQVTASLFCGGPRLTDTGRG